ncbi:hypothetical protein AHAS_Ahas01G0172500 [Arachis hypogaea]
MLPMSFLYLGFIRTLHIIHFLMDLDTLILYSLEDQVVPPPDPTRELFGPFVDTSNTTLADGPVFTDESALMDLNGDNSIRKIPEVIEISDDDEDHKEYPNVIKILFSNSNKQLIV